MALAEAPAGVLFDNTQYRHLAEIYAPCFTLILQLRATSEYGAPDLLRQRVLDLLNRCEREAMRTGLPTPDNREAKFAIVAFLDETILLSDWSMREYWAAKPLQLELYERYDAGEEFFNKLEKLMEQSSERPEVLEVYYLCMTLGFKGRYQLHDQERLRVLIEEVLSMLRRVPGMDAGELSPHGRPHGQVEAEVRTKVPTWAILGLAAALALLVYIGMSVYATSTAASTARTIDALSQSSNVRP